MPTADKIQKGEVWKSPPSLGKWWVEVSNFGRMRTLDRYVDYVRQGNVKRHDFKKGRILKIGGDSRGRPIYSYDGHSRLIRDLVAECFVPKCGTKDIWVFHKDGNIGNCRANNLCWGWAKKDFHVMGRLVGAFREGEVSPYLQGGLTYVAEHLGVSKQAIHYAIKTERKCNGVAVKYLKSKDKRIFENDSFPDALYAN